MKNWEKALRKIKFLGFLCLFAASIGAVINGFATDAEVATMEETNIPAPEMVLTKEVKASGEIIFRLVPADEVGVITEEVTLDGEEPEEKAAKATAQKQRQKRLPVAWEEEETAEELEEEAVSYVPEKQPTVFVQATSNKTVEKYAGSIDYDAILQDPVIYDFGPEGELALEWVVWHESRGEPFDGQVAVAASAINRWEGDCPWFPDKSSIVAILSQPWQFAYQYVSTEDLEAYPDVHMAVQAAIRGADPTVCETFPDGAQWYYNPSETDQTFHEANYELVIGHHHFHNYGYKWK